MCGCTKLLFLGDYFPIKWNPEKISNKSREKPRKTFITFIISKPMKPYEKRLNVMKVKLFRWKGSGANELHKFLHISGNAVKTTLEPTHVIPIAYIIVYPLLRTKLSNLHL